MMLLKLVLLDFKKKQVMDARKARAAERIEWLVWIRLGGSWRERGSLLLDISRRMEAISEKQHARISQI